MPIQIRELIVTATVEDQKANGGSPSSVSSPKSMDAASKEELVQACVDEVLKVLKQQGRR